MTEMGPSRFARSCRIGTMPSMASQNSNATGTTTRTVRLQFFCTHGPLSPERQGYIRRSSDEAAFAALQAGRFVDVTGSPLTGKTSLLLRVADRLRAAEDEPLVAFIDVRQLLQRDSNEDVARWFYAIAYRLARQLRVGFDLQTWWADNAMLSHHHRLVELYRELVLALPRRRIVVLFDDVHEFAARDSAEALLTSFRSAHDARASDPEMNRLTIGYAHNGVRRFGREHLQHLPYAIATHVAVVPMRLADTLKLAPALGLPRDQGELAMQRIFDWVSGHPAMTQWLAAELAQVLTDDGDAVATVDAIVARRLNKTAGAPAHEAIARIERRILRARESLREAILLTLGRLAKNGRLLFDPASKAHDRLLLLGVLELGPDGYLLFSSRIFRRYFGARWASRHLPTRIRGVVRAVAVVLLCTTIPAWYFMVLPQRPTAILMDTNAAVEDVVRAADRLGFWPGYRGAATRMVRFALLQRLQEIQSAEELAALLAPVQARLNDSARSPSSSAAFNWRCQNSKVSSSISAE
ncbi:MAG: AAA-like domain-containing protein, partial [Pseudomonadota bacterium]